MSNTVRIIAHGQKYGHPWFLVECTCGFTSPVHETTDRYICPKSCGASAKVDDLYTTYSTQPELDWTDDLPFE